MLRPSQTQSDHAKILIVDDKPINIELLEAFLSSEGYQTIAATSGQEALDKIDTENPCLVLLGVIMPDMNGFEVCQRIKSNPATLYLPVVLVTAPKNVEDRVKGAQVGVDDFLSKPVERQELLARVRSLLRIKTLHDALEYRTQQLAGAKQEAQDQLEEKTRLSPGRVSAVRLDRAPSRPQAPRFRPGAASSRPHPQSSEHPLESVQQLASGPGRAANEASSELAEEVDQAVLRDLKKHFLERLSEILEGPTDLTRTPEMVNTLRQRLGSLYEASGLQVADEVREQLFREVVDEILGYGPIDPLLADPAVSEVMVNGPYLVYIERGGKISKTDIKFDNDDHVLRVIDRIVRPLGRRVDRNSPMVDARLPDGSRVNAVIPPCAVDGPSITIRKFNEDKLTVEDLVSFGTLTPHMAEFLEACVQARLNTVVAGGTGSGKTTTLNVLSSFIPSDERIVTIEDSAELQLHQEHVVRLEAKPPDLDGTGQVTIRDLVRNSLRMRPERIIVGEVRGPEALDMLQAMNTGHDGSLTTVHANSPRDTVARLETLVLMTGLDLPLRVVRAQLASAIDLIIQQTRLRDGSRKVTNITEVQGMEGDTVVLSDIFVFNEQGMKGDEVVGELVPTGVRPKFSTKLEIAGFQLPADLFMSEDQLGRLRRRR